MAECVFTVALMKKATRRHSHTGEETEQILAEDRSKFLVFLPDSIFVIPKDNDT